MDTHDGAAGPVDLVHLARYTLGEAVLEREVLGLCTQSVLYLEQMRAAMSDKAWKDASDSLKPPCAPSALGGQRKWPNARRP